MSLRTPLFALALLVSSGCRTRPYDPFETPPLPDFTFIPPDFTTPPDLTVPPDFLPPPDLVPPHYCNGIFAFDTDNHLYFFDPIKLTFTDIHRLDCPAMGNAQPFSMAVGRDGIAWVEYTSGELFQVDTDTGACSATKFAPNQPGFRTFGMGFAADAPGSPDETLYIANDGSMDPRLGRIDLKSLLVAPIGPLPADAELTGTGSGELWAFFGDVLAHAGRIDKRTGVVVEDVPMAAVGDASRAGFAFAFFGGDFWLFIYTGGFTRVYQLHRPSNQVTLPLPNTNRHIVGAGVSTCAPG